MSCERERERRERRISKAAGCAIEVRPGEEGRGAQRYLEQYPLLGPVRDLPYGAGDLGEARVLWCRGRHRCRSSFRCVGLVLWSSRAAGLVSVACLDVYIERNVLFLDSVFYNTPASLIKTRFLRTQSEFVRVVKEPPSKCGVFTRTGSNPVVRDPFFFFR